MNILHICQPEELGVLVSDVVWSSPIGGVLSKSKYDRSSMDCRLSFDVEGLRKDMGARYYI